MFSHCMGDGTLYFVRGLVSVICSVFVMIRDISVGLFLSLFFWYGLH